LFKKNNLWIIFLFLALTIAFFAKALFTKTTFIYGDTYLLYYPLKRFIASNLRNFSIPQWNPYVACGMPVVSDPVQQMFYPLTFLSLIFNFNLFYKLFIISHYLIAGLAAYFLMRGLRCSTYGSLFSGIAFMFCGYMVFSHSNPIYISSAAWMPLAFFFFMKIFQDGKKLFWCIACSFITGIQVLGGDIQLVYAEFVFFLIYILFSLKESKASVSGHLIKYSFRMIFVLFFTCLFSAVLILPIYFLLPFSDRGSGYAFDEATKWSFHPLRIIEFFTPYVFGSTIYDNNYWGMFLQSQKAERVWTEIVYIGILPLVFSVYAFFLKKDRDTRFFSFLGALSLILAFGSFTPLYFLFYKTFPFFSSFRYPEKYLIFTSFSLAILGGLGFEEYLKKIPLVPSSAKVDSGGFEIKIIKNISILIIILLVLLFSFTVYLKTAPLNFKIFLLSRNINVSLNDILSSLKSAGFYFFFISALSVSLIWLGLRQKISSRVLPAAIILVLIIDLWQIGLKSYPLFREDYYDFIPYGKLVIDRIENKKPEFFRTYCSDKFIKGYNYPELEELSANEKTWIFNKNILKAATGMNFGIFHGDFYGSFQLRKQKELVERLKGKRISFDLMNIKYIFAPKEFFEKTPYPAVFIHPKGEFAVFKNTSFLPKLFTVKKVRTCLTEQEILESLSSDEFNPKEEVIVSRKDFIENSRESLTSNAGGENRLEILNYEPNSISLNVALKEQGFLVFLENFFPGWEAVVNGKGRDVVRVDYAFVGVPLDSGVSRVKLSFIHPGFPLGLEVTTFAFIFYILFLILCFVRSKLPRASARGF